MDILNTSDQREVCRRKLLHRVRTGQTTSTDADLIEELLCRVDDVSNSCSSTQQPGSCLPDFLLAHQPIVSKDHHLFGYEVLARAPGPGDVYSAAFIADLKQRCQLSLLDQHVLDKSIELLAGSSLSGVDHLFINVSPATLSSPLAMMRFVDIFSELAELNAGKVVVEVSEKAWLAEPELDYFISCIHAQNALVAIDDYGVGNSDVSRLRNHPWDIVKIDWRPDQRRKASNVDLLAEVSLIKEAEALVLVEGVETEADIELIGQMDEVDLVQGFALGLPMIVS